MSKTLGERLADLNIEVGTAMTIDWEQVRIQAAIASMNIVKGAYNIHDDIEQLVRHSVRIADALVAELKRSEDVYAECRRMDAINTASVCENMIKIQKEFQKKGGKDETE